MNRTERGEDLNRRVEEAFEELEQQLLQGHSEHFLEALRWWSQLRQYSFGNCWLIKAQKRDAIACAGFRQWEKLGFTVRKGESALWIKAPCIAKVADEETGELVERLVGWLAVPVFDIQQCNEWPEKQPPQPFQPASGEEWEDFYERSKRRIQTIYGIQVREFPMGNAYGMATKTRIGINSLHDYNQRGPSLIHEWAHVLAGHVERRDISIMEAEWAVEVTTYVVCHMMGADHPGAVDYLLNYHLEPGKLRSMMDVVSRLVNEVLATLQIQDTRKPAEMPVAA